MSDSVQIPLFPLSAHIFPGGKMALRIFEARYLRMVKETLKAQTGFGICMFNAHGDKERNQHIYPIGTYVKIIDFDMLDDGLLGITVEGQYLFTVGEIQTQQDGLRVGEIEELPLWSSDTFPGIDAPLLQERLVQIIASYPELQSLYTDPPLKDLSWVVFRWLELLPIKAADKQQLMTQQNPKVVVEFLESLIR